MYISMVQYWKHRQGATMKFVASLAVLTTLTLGCETLSDIADTSISNAETCAESGGTWVYSATPPNWGVCNVADSTTAPIVVVPVDGGNGPVDPIPQGECLPAHPGATHTALFCGDVQVYVLPANDWIFTNGRFTALITGIGDIGTPQAAGLFVVHGQAIGAGEQNVHGLLFNNGNPGNNSLRTSHAWFPQTGAHKEQHGHWQKYPFRADNVYTLDCQWDAVNFTCDIYSRDVKLQSHTRTLFSPFGKLVFGGTKGIRVGNRAVRQFDAGSRVRVLAVRVSVVE